MARALVERYEEDLAHVRGGAGWAAVASLLIGLAALPLVLPPLGRGYLLFIIILIAANVLVAVGLNLLVGYAGLISLGHAGFVAIGAYASGLLMARLGWPWWAAWPGAVAVCAGAGFVVGVPALRLTGPYLTIATLGFGIAVYQVLTNWTGLSGGRMGLPVPALSLGVPSLSTTQQLCYASLAATGAACWVAYNLSRSHVGRALVAIRDSDIAASVTGVDLTRYKTLAFALSAAYAGLAGCIVAQALRHLEPQSFTVFDSIAYLTMIVIGGLGTITGGIIGGIVLTVLPVALSGFRQWLPVIYGAVILLVMAVEPHGIYGRWMRVKRYLKTWPL